MLIVYRCLNNGIVDKVEVVNKQWVRIKLLPGHYIDGSVSLQIKSKYTKFIKYIIICLVYFVGDCMV